MRKLAVPGILLLLCASSARAGVNPEVILGCRMLDFRGEHLLVDCGAQDKPVRLLLPRAKLGSSAEPRPGSSFSLQARTSELGPMIEAAEKVAAARPRR
jgi:hypothetical protein